MTAWTDHLKAASKKLNISYKEAMSHPGVKAAYNKMKGRARKPLAKVAAEVMPEVKMTLKKLRSLAKEQGHKLSVNGKPHKKAHLMQLVGGKINRLKKAKGWTGYAYDTAKKGLDLAKTGATIAEMF